MAISDHFSASDVMLDVRVRNKSELIELLAAKAAGRLGRASSEIVDALKSREDLGATALGRGVGLPHAELQGAISPLMLFARLSSRIEFDARDGEPVDLAFLVLWPAEATKGLIEAMAEICRALRDTEVLRRLRIVATADEVAKLMCNPGALGKSFSRREDDE